MALPNIIENDLDTGCPNLLLCCNLHICIQVDDYVVTEGETSISVWSYAFNPIATETIEIYSVLFTFVNGAPATQLEVDMSSGLPATILLNLINAVNSHPVLNQKYFAFEGASNRLHVTSQEVGLDADYSSASSSSNAYVFSVVLSSAGVDWDFLDNFYLNLRAINTRTDEAFCYQPSIPPKIVDDTIFGGGGDLIPVVCFPVNEWLRSQYDFSRTLPTIPDPTLEIQLSCEEVLKFKITAYESYRQENSCEVIIGGGLTTPEYRALDVGCCTDLNDGACPDIVDVVVWKNMSFTSEFRYCLDDYIWAAFYLHNPIGEITNVSYIFKYKTILIGTSNFVVPDTDSCVYRYGFRLSDWISTIEAGAQIEVIPRTHIGVGITERESFFVTTAGDMECCNCHQQFFYYNTCGALVSVIALCENQLTIEVDEVEICTDKSCGDFLNGRKILTSYSRKTRTNIFDADIDTQDEILDFIASPDKYIIEDGEWKKIMSVTKSMTIRQTSNKIRGSFSYQVVAEEIPRR